eukprot:scaffold88197_cov19-Tisochrysis_lutea.AAC.3
MTKGGLQPDRPADQPMAGPLQPAAEHNKQSSTRKAFLGTLFCSPSFRMSGVCKASRRAPLHCSTHFQPKHKGGPHSLDACCLSRPSMLPPQWPAAVTCCVSVAVTSRVTLHRGSVCSAAVCALLLQCAGYRAPIQHHQGHDP